MRSQSATHTCDNMLSGPDEHPPIMLIITPEFRVRTHVVAYLLVGME